MGYMFKDCTSLTSLDLSGFNTSNVESMSQMFYNSTALTDIDITGWDTSKVKDMYSMFAYCSALKNIDTSAINTSNSESIEQMFLGCGSLEKIDLTYFNTSKVKSLSALFSGCSKLEEIDLSSFDTSNTTSMSGMFYGCTSLKALDLSGFDTSNVTDMQTMFKNCYGLTYLDLTSFQTPKLTKVRNMFDGCTVLEYADLSTIDTSGATNSYYGTNMFGNVPMLRDRMCSLSSTASICGETLSTEFFLDLPEGAARVTVSGENGDVEYTDLASLRQDDGTYLFNYESALEARGDLAVSVYDGNGRKLIAVNENDSLLPKSDVRCDIGVKPAMEGQIYYPGDTIVFDSDKGQKISCVDYYYENTFKGSYKLTAITGRGFGKSISKVEFSNGSQTFNLQYQYLSNLTAVGIKLKYDGYKTAFEPQFIYNAPLEEVKGTEPTCTSDGKLTYFTDGYGRYFTDKFYTRIDDLNGDGIKDERDLIIPALGHNWSEPVYEWSEDNTSCTRTFICLNDNSHVLSQTVDAVLKTTENGEAYYEANFAANTEVEDDKGETLTKLADKPDIPQENVYSVTVRVGDTETTSLCEEKSLFKCTSEGEGGWFINGILASTNNNLSFTVLGDTVVEWQEDEFTQDGVVNCVLSGRTDMGAHVTVLATSTWAVPDDAIILTAGTSRCYVEVAEDTPDKQTVFETGKKYDSSLKTTNGTFQYNVNMGSASSAKKLCMVAYVTYQTGEETITIISDVAVSMNE